MAKHCAYSDSSRSDIEDLDWYYTNISEPDSETLELYIEETQAALEELRKAYGYVVEDVRFVYGDWTDERAAELIEGENTSFTSGYSFHPEIQSWVSEPTIFLKSSTEYSGWEDGFRNAVIHEVAHQLFYAGAFSEFSDQLDSIVFEGHAMALAKDMCERFGYEYDSPWRPDELIDVDLEAVKEELPKRRTLTNEESDEVGNLFRNGEPFSNQEGYIMGYQFGRWLVSSTEYELMDFPDFSREKREKLVGRGLAELYGPSNHD